MVGDKTAVGAMVTRVPDPETSTATRGKRKRVHKPAMDAKKELLEGDPPGETAAAAFDDINTAEGGTCSFFAPTNLRDVG